MARFISSKKQVAVLALAVLIVICAIVGAIHMVKFKDEESENITTDSVTEESTSTKATYVVDVEYVEKMIGETRFTDKFETYKASSYPSSGKTAKDAYWAGIQQGNTVNPLLLAATSTYLNTLGFNTPAIKPSELYSVIDDGAYLNAKGEEVLKKVKEFIYSDETKVFTSDLGSSASKLYNSSSSNEKGIVYASKVGITGNTACWVITTQNIDIDDQFDDILEIEQNKSTEQTTKSASSKTTVVAKNTMVQLCRCGNTVTENPPKEEPTTKPKTTEPTTKPRTTEPTTKPKTTEPTTKNKQQDPVNQSNAQRGGGSKRSAEDTTATTRYDPVEPTMPSSVRRVVTTTVPATTKPATTKPATTKPATTAPATTKPTTTAPKAEPTHVESNTYVDKKTGETTVVNDDTVVTGKVNRPKR